MSQSSPSTRGLITSSAQVDTHLGPLMFSAARSSRSAQRHLNTLQTSINQLSQPTLPSVTCHCLLGSPIIPPTPPIHPISSRPTPSSHQSSICNKCESLTSTRTSINTPGDNHVGRGPADPGNMLPRDEHALPSRYSPEDGVDEAISLNTASKCSPTTIISSSNSDGVDEGTFFCDDSFFDQLSQPSPSYPERSDTTSLALPSVRPDSASNATITGPPTSSLTTPPELSGIHRSTLLSNPNHRSNTSPSNQGQLAFLPSIPQRDNHVNTSSPSSSARMYSTKVSAPSKGSSTATDITSQSASPTEQMSGSTSPTSASSFPSAPTSSSPSTSYLSFSPTELALFMSSPWAAWMERLYKERPDRVQKGMFYMYINLDILQSCRGYTRFLISDID